MQSHIVSETRKVFCSTSDDIIIHNKCNGERRGHKGKDNLATILKTFKLFTKDVVQDLQNIANKDIVNTDLKEDLLIAHKKWQ